MQHFRVFTDGSVNTHLRIGYGAYLVVTDMGIPISSLKDKVKARRFEQTSSSKLELQTLLWALNDINALAKSQEFSLTVYTDSQMIIGLPGRRSRLEKNNYYSSNNKRLNNYELYREFYRLTSGLDCDFVKVVGHQPSNKKGDMDKLFSLVDKAARRALREGA